MLVSGYVGDYGYFYLQVYACECMCVCTYVCTCVTVSMMSVFMAQIENNSADDSNTKVISPCSCFSTYKTRTTMHLVDIKMHPNIKHLGIAILDIK